MVTIDASVLVAAAVPDEVEHEPARRVLGEVIASGTDVHLPTLAIVEVTAAIARRTGDVELAMAAGRRVLEMPGLVLHDLDVDEMAVAARLVSELGLRAADAIYVAVARTGGVLVTLDVELRGRAGSVAAALLPAEWLATLER